ncbi:MAG: hypothetical protein LC800_06715 [Acidobacteria bacterium]|nr:hypothetical protein [Acidobacteriota bacterium]
MTTTTHEGLVVQFAGGEWHAPPANRRAGGIIFAADSDEFARAASAVISSAGHGEVLERAIAVALQSADAPLELSFIGLFAALESVLTFFRRQGDYEILPAEEFAQLEGDLKVWLRQRPQLAGDPARRGLVYEKVRELNRFPFSHVFGKFCARRALDLSDLWPVFAPRDEWPLVEIRHRLVHGDPFRSRPAEAVECARQHLKWATARVILAAFGWPVARSRVSADYVARAGGPYDNWRDERAKLA